MRWIKFKCVYCECRGLFVHERVHSPLKVQWHIPDSLWKSQTFLSLFRRWFVHWGCERGTGKWGVVSLDVSEIQCNAFDSTFSHLRFKLIFIFERKFNPHVSASVALLAFIARKQEVTSCQHYKRPKDQVNFNFGKCSYHPKRGSKSPGNNKRKTNIILKCLTR